MMNRRKKIKLLQKQVSELRDEIYRKEAETYLYMVEFKNLLRVTTGGSLTDPTYDRSKIYHHVSMHETEKWVKPLNRLRDMLRALYMVVLDNSHQPFSFGWWVKVSHRHDASQVVRFYCRDRMMARWPYADEFHWPKYIWDGWPGVAPKSTDEEEE